jgi:hypothetical protein
MVQPIDYNLNVLSPMQRFTEGLKFGEDLLTARLARDETQQMMGMRAAQEARAVAAAEEQRAAAEAERARAAEFQNDLAGLVGLANGGLLTADAINAVGLKHAKTLDEALGFFTSMEKERQKPLADFGRKVATLSMTGNAAAAEALYQERIEAAKNTGTPEAMQEAQALEADLAALKANPINFGTMELLSLRRAGVIDDKELETLLDMAKQGQGPEFRRATPEEAAAYGAQGGQFGPDGRFYAVDVPQGMTIESDGAGGFRMVQGAGATSAKPFTEGQSKDVVFATRAKGALEVLEPVAGNLTSLGSRAADIDPTGIIRGRVQSPEYQVAKQAGDEFLQAILRKDTGAAITVPEQALYGVTYLPQPGDGPAVLEAKRAARQRAVAAIEGGMSPAQMIAQERALSGSEPAPAGGRARYDENGDRIK